MSHLSIEAPTCSAQDGSPAVRRLLFVADAAVANVQEFPPAARALIESATEVYVLTPALPGRLAWLADDVDRPRHVADRRLETVLAHLRSIGVAAHGLPRRGSVLTVIADAIADVAPDHILVALRSFEHANWQERRLVEHVEDRFGLPVTTYGVDVDGHTASAFGPLLLCYDGSADAAHAIERAGTLFPNRTAVVVTVWQPFTITWTGEIGVAIDVAGLDREAAEVGGRVAAVGMGVAQRAGLDADSLTVRAAGSVWKAILDVADRHDAAAIVMGSRGLTGLRWVVLGSVSSAVAEHADRPTLIIRPSVAAA